MHGSRKISASGIVTTVVVHRASTTAPRSRALSPGTDALDVEAFVKELRAIARPRRSRRAN
jgi:hypothetical protein